MFPLQPVEEAPITHMSVSGRSAEQGGLQYPMVWASVAAGVIGVILVVVIILSIWVRRRCCSLPPKPIDQCQKAAIYVHANPAGASSSRSSSPSRTATTVPQAAAVALAELHIVSEKKYEGSSSSPHKVNIMLI